jgi:DNA (cytosine-5)-methyltransferase 1
MARLRFVDLFAGLGGFHVALRRLGHECVFAAEIDPDLGRLYQENFGIEPSGDVRLVDVELVPDFDVLCAGFPCQPFSKAGTQKGLACDKNGDLAELIVQWLHAKRPRYFILENVPNLLKHDSGRTWRWLSLELRHAGYAVDARILSAHDLGIPQVRERLFIVGTRDSLGHFEWPTQVSEPASLDTVLDQSPVDATWISGRVAEALETWQEFLDSYPRNRRKPWFPIWAAEFGANYPFTTTAPLAVSPKVLRSYRGAFGQSLDVRTLSQIEQRLPPYARSSKQFPDWKIRFLQLNRDLYEENRDWIDPWLPKLLRFEHSFQKFEWNFDDEHRSLWRTVVQLRGSGIRAKSATSAPTLVAASPSQVPIIAWQRRYMTARERARLQDLGELRCLPATVGATTRALGNAVNARVVELVARRLLAPTMPSSYEPHKQLDEPDQSRQHSARREHSHRTATPELQALVRPC